MNVLVFAAAQNRSIPPFVPAPKVYTGCMGRIVPNLIEGQGGKTYPGAYDLVPDMVFSWLLHLFCAESQATILQFFKDAGDEDWLLSWPDFESQDPQAFGALILQVRRAGFRPKVMLCNKSGPTDLAGLQAKILPVIPILAAYGVPRVGVGWELDSFLDPGDITVTPPRVGVMQPLIDWLSIVTGWWGAFLYVHFTGGRPSWQPNGLLFADFWNRNVGKLRGLFHQKVTLATDAEYQTGEGGLRDILLHFNGGSGCTADSGDGTPFDLIAGEVNLEECSGENGPDALISEAEMHRRARIGVQTPPTTGPTGVVAVLGSGCGL